MGSDAATGMMPSGIHPCALKVPQARKASLARFLEKRKGRDLMLMSKFGLKGEDRENPAGKTLAISIQYVIMVKYK
ncbi:hypothetical protein Golob_025253 [Gossypium lobatum]|uniref:Uncharacterized protein n=1 Tax=Gossypium lobatum TaxID=34289 RepID=A0A7J8NK62_9ROSI|nr:hypothetical protein [Gossypium lobatum]